LVEGALLSQLIAQWGRWCSLSGMRPFRSTSGFFCHFGVWVLLWKMSFCERIEVLVDKTSVFRASWVNTLPLETRFGVLWFVVIVVPCLWDNLFWHSCGWCSKLLFHRNHYFCFRQSCFCKAAFVVLIAEWGLLFYIRLLASTDLDFLCSPIVE